jgi:multicomponent Na+:H+ antiporter subunit E
LSNRKKKHRTLRRLRGIMKLVPLYIKDLFLANLKLAHEALRFKLTMRPTMVKVPVNFVSEFEILLLAHLITITPGTLSVDYLNKEKNLLVHLVFSEEAESFVQEIVNKWEPLIKEIFG